MGLERNKRNAARVICVQCSVFIISVFFAYRVAVAAQEQQQQQKIPCVWDEIVHLMQPLMVTMDHIGERCIDGPQQGAYIWTAYMTLTV